ncbi:hypothetical protein ACJHYX_19305, partial [Escherichia sp. WS533]
ESLIKQVLRAYIFCGACGNNRTNRGGFQFAAARLPWFSPNYYQTRQNLLDIESLKVDDLDIHAYRYVMKPTLPIRRDSPKKAIILILAVLLGGMVGAGIVLGRNALRNYNAK